MKKFIAILFSITVFILSCSISYAQSGYFGQAKANIYGDWGFDVGVSFTDNFGVRAGLMTDMDRIDVGDGKDTKIFEEVLGNNYRLSYSAGPMFRLAKWMWVSATAGYGEIGTYAYNSMNDLYGISGKIKGLEAGFQIQFRLSSMTLEVGYCTLTDSFALGRPYHDISFGIGVYI